MLSKRALVSETHAVPCCCYWNLRCDHPGVVDKILVSDEEVTIQHTVPISDVRLWRDHYTGENRS